VHTYLRMYKRENERQVFMRDCSGFTFLQNRRENRSMEKSAGNIPAGKNLREITNVLNVSIYIYVVKILTIIWTQ